MKRTVFIRTIRNLRSNVPITSVLLAFVVTAQAQITNIIPADRLPPGGMWQAGIPGGIPHFTNLINVALPPYNCPTNGSTNDVGPILQSAINAATNGQVVYLPPGTYNITTPFYFQAKTNVVLRGAGPALTRIVGVMTSAWGLMALSSGSWSGGYNLTANAVVGANTANVTSTNLLRVGSYYCLVEPVLNTNILFGIPGYFAPPMRQIFRLTNLGPNTIYSAQPWYYAFSTNWGAQVASIDNLDQLVYQCGIEDLYISQSNFVSGMASIILDHCVQCWVTNVESFQASGAHIKLTGCFQCNVQHCYLHHGFDYTSGHAYGVWLFDNNTDCLVENNVLYHLRHGMCFEGGCCGCVVAYNYQYGTYGDNYPNDNVLMEGIHTHGGGPWMNLFEGNVTDHLVLDSALGSSRWMTCFRNYSVGNAPGTTNQAITDNLNGMELQKNQLCANVVGCVLGSINDAAAWKNGCHQFDCSTIDERVDATAIRYYNWNGVTNGLDWTGTWTNNVVNPGYANLPNSLYLTNKPAWFGFLTWPPIDPMNPAYSVTRTNIPAGYRFLLGSDPPNRPAAPRNLRVLTE